jgi:hypothetical protein
MSVITVACEVREYPEDGKKPRSIVVRNHWNEHHKVVLEIDGQRYTVFAEHLEKAIKNATNAHANYF